MDQKLVRCMSSLKEEAEAARAGDLSSDLNSLIKDVFDLCKQAVSDEDVSFSIAVIFDKENGIFSVLDLIMAIKEKTVVKARESCCTFLAAFIEQIGDRALPHAAVLKVFSFVSLSRPLPYHSLHEFHLPSNCRFVLSLFVLSFLCSVTLSMSCGG